MSNTPAPINIEESVAKYVKLREIIKNMDDEHKKKMAPAREALETLNNLMLQHLQNLKIDSAKTAAGTVYTTERKSASIADQAAFMRHVIGGEHWDLLDKKANATACEDFARENGVLPPGINLTISQIVGVRKSA